MCGLIAQIKKVDDGVPTHDTIKGMLASQIHRGTQGFGYIAFDDVVKSYVRRETRPEIERLIDKNTMRSIIFHHRIPTSTPNLADCTHPIKVSNKELKFDYYLIHNGMISNDGPLRTEHLELGYEYNTTIESSVKTNSSFNNKFQWNDSEALAIDVARYLDGKQEKIKSRGSIAFIVAQVDKKSEKVINIFFGRNNSSPLTMKFTEAGLILRSEGEKNDVEANFMYCLNMKTFKITKKACQVGEMWSVRNDPSQGYFHSDMSKAPYVPYRDWDDDDRTPVGIPVYRGGTVSKSDSARRQLINDFDEELADEEIADQFTHQEVAKVNAILEELDERLAEKLEDLQVYKGLPGAEAEVEATEADIRQIEEDIDKFEVDKELLLSGEFTDVNPR